MIEMYNLAGASTSFHLDSRLNKFERSTPTLPNTVNKTTICNNFGGFGCETEEEKWFDKTVSSTFFNTTTKIYQRAI